MELTIRVPAAVADANTPDRARVLLRPGRGAERESDLRAAATTLGIAPDAFLALARVHGIPVVRFDDADLRDDLFTLAKLEHSRTAHE